MITTMLLMTTLIGGEAGELKKEFIASGATAKTGGYRPIRAKMSEKKKKWVKKSPEGLSNPRYGKLRLGGKSWGFILDDTADKPARLFVDTNGDGDLTNDPKTTWAGKKMYRGDSKLDLGDSRLGAIKLYRFDPNDKRRASLKNTILFYTDFGYELTLKLDGKPFKTFVSGELQPTTRLWIDRDGNKKRSAKKEMVQVGMPFNFTGTTYVLSVVGGEGQLRKATEALSQASLPPNLVVGQPALDFKMAAMDGTEIDFPRTYKGKIVMLDFWATWCGPCIRELPNVKKAYDTWHGKGFEILGISFDRKDMADKVKEFTEKRGMPWKHLYEGKRWDTTIGELYDVGSIPFVLLVDGDTGKILATTRQLRGAGLSDFIGKALAKKNKNKTE